MFRNKILIKSVVPEYEWCSKGKIQEIVYKFAKYEVQVEAGIVVINTCYISREHEFFQLKDCND